MLDLLLYGKKFFQSLYILSMIINMSRVKKFLHFPQKIYQNLSIISILIFRLSLELFNTYVGTYYIIIFKKTIPSALDVSLPLFLTFDRL